MDFSKIVNIGVEYIWKQYLFIPILPYVTYKIKSIDKDIDLKNLVNFTRKFCFGLISPLQVPYELLELLKIIKKEKPKYILEIGTSLGGTLFLFSRIATEDAIIISVDLPFGEFGGGYSTARIPLYNSFKSKNQKIILIRGNSHNEITLEKVRNILNKKKIDLLFIDGDHTYKGVKKDFEMYSKLVKKGGMIALHDIIKCKVERCNVNLFWDEIKSKYDTIEIVNDYNQQWAGIGLIKK